jgi:hypothetical protein
LLLAFQWFLDDSNRNSDEKIMVKTLTVVRHEQYSYGPCTVLIWTIWVISNIIWDISVFLTFFRWFWFVYIYSIKVLLNDKENSVVRLLYMSICNIINLFLSLHKISIFYNRIIDFCLKRFDCFVHVEWKRWWMGSCKSWLGVENSIGWGWVTHHPFLFIAGELHELCFNTNKEALFFQHYYMHNVCLICYLIYLLFHCWLHLWKISILISLFFGNSSLINCTKGPLIIFCDVEISCCKLIIGGGD